MQTLNRRLLRTVRNSWLQFTALVVIIALGLLSLVLLTNVYQNMHVSKVEYYRQQSFAEVFASFTYQPSGYIDRLDNLPEIRRSEGRIVSDIRVDVGRDTHPTLRLVSISDENRLNRPLTQQGALPRGRSREVALLTRFAEANDIEVGDSVELIIRGEPFSVEVSALVDSPEFVYAIEDIKNPYPDDTNFGVAYMDLNLLQDLLGVPGQVNEATFLTAPGVSWDEARDAVQERMEGRGLRSVITRDDQLSHFMISIEMDFLQQFSFAIPLVFLAIAAAIIYMLISRLVKSDRVVIGVLKATGYDNRQVLMHYLKYALFLGFAGAALGMAAGHAFVGPTTELYMEFFELPLMQMRYDWTFIVVGVVLTLIFCGGTGVWAARDVLKISPADAMRPPAPPPGQRNLLEVSFPRLWERMSFSWKLVWRHLLRNKKRFALAVLGVAFTFTVVFFPFYALGVIDIMFIQQFEEFEVYDYAVSFEQPVGGEGISHVGELVQAELIEPFAEYPFNVSRGWREHNVVVRALSTDSTLQRFEDARGGIIEVPASGLLISQYLAEELGVGPGDRLTLSSHVTDGEEHTVEVQAVINQYLGSGIYMSRGQMNRLTGQHDHTGVLIQSNDDVKAALQNAANVASIYSTGDLIDVFDEFMGLVIVAYSTLILIGGVLGFAILFNTTSVSIEERAREFSSMRVLGYSQGEVYQALVRENILATAAGVILGIPLSRASVHLLVSMMQTEMFYLPPVINPGSYAIAGILVGIFTAVVMLAVRVRVHNLNLLEALSSRLT